MDPHINPASGVWDDNYYAQTQGGGGGGGGAPAPFNFDYSGEAKKAYGELGSYYNRILEWAKGDLNKALARLTEDYDRGVRFKKEDTQLNTEQTVKGITNNALSRGLYQKSAFGDQTPNPSKPLAGFGIPTENYRVAKQTIDTGLSRYLETAGVDLKRSQTDLPEQEQRKEFDLEQQRRMQASQLANDKASLALQDYNAKLF